MLSPITLKHLPEKSIVLMSIVFSTACIFTVTISPPYYVSLLSKFF